MGSISEIAVSRDSPFLSVPVHSHTGNHMHTPLSLSATIQRLLPSYITTSHSCPSLSLSPPSSVFFLLSFTPLSFWSTFPFHPSSSSSPERLICDWACCVFYRRLAAARGQRAAEMPRCLYILPVRRCKRMKRDWHSVICAEKLKYSRGWMEAAEENEGWRRMGARFVIDYAKFPAKREARQRITGGETESSESLFVLDFSFLFFSHTHSKKQKNKPLLKF